MESVLVAIGTGVVSGIVTALIMGSELKVHVGHILTRIENHETRLHELETHQ